MPFTPYHFGPSGFLGLVFRKWIDIPVFVLANVVVDVEVLVLGGLGAGWPVHRYSHTLLGGVVVGALWGAAAYSLRHFFKKTMGLLRISYEGSFWKMTISGILGAWLHVLIDGLYHFDAKIFWPNRTLSMRRIIYYCGTYIDTDHVYRHEIVKEQIKTICVAFFIASVIVYILARIVSTQNVASKLWGFLKFRKRYWLLPIAMVLVMLGALMVFTESSVTEAYDLTFSTYFGGSDWEHVGDVAVDKYGNIYLVGGTASQDFPTTPGAYSRTLCTGGTQAFGPCDVFVAKFTPEGRLLWSTLIGGPGYDRAYAVEVDQAGHVYVGGRAGPDFPIKQAFQPHFDGVENGPHGVQNAFVLKLAPDGADLSWSSYVGVSTLCSDLVIDSEGDVYIPGGRWNTSKTPPSVWFADAYQKTPPGGESDCGVIKIKGDGSQVLWATWLGGSGSDTSSASIWIGPDQKVYIGGSTFSRDFPTTAGAHDRTYNGEADVFVACLTPDGSDLVYSTYLGGPGNEWISTHNLAVDDHGYAYIAIATDSPSYPTTRGAFQTNFRGGNTDWAITKLSPAGALTASTLIGGKNGENANGVYVDSEGGVFITGETQSPDFPVTTEPYQANSSGGTEAIIVRLSSDLSRLLYSSYLGGRDDEKDRTGFLGQDGSLYVAGSVNGSDWPTRNAYQAQFAGGTLDNTLARFTPRSTIMVDPRTTYQTISGWEAVAYALEPSNPAFPNFKDLLFDQAVNDLGVNRVRLEIRSGVENSNDNWSSHQAGRIDYQTWRSRRYATINDNYDPFTIDWSGFHFSEIDHMIEAIVDPLRTLCEGRGEKLHVNLNYVAFTNQIAAGSYIHDDPAEYAEFVLATYLHLKSKYGWVPDSWEVILEPDNVSQWDGKLIGEAIVAAAERLAASGFEPAFVAPSTTNMGNAIRYSDQMLEVPGVLPFVRELSYHRYGGVSVQNLRTIASRAEQHRIATSMLEWWSNNNNYQTLHEDLKIGNNSAWQQGALAGSLTSKTALYRIDDSDPDHPRILLNEKTKFARQYYRFIKRGALRIKSTSQDNNFDPLAFINENGGYVVVVKCDSGGDFSIGGLAAGRYGVKYTTASQFDMNLPHQTISFGQPLVTGIPERGVLTVYAAPALPDDQAPTAPIQLAVDNLSPFKVTFTWEASTDSAAVAGYKVYRDGVRIGFSQTNSFEDIRVEPATSYTYSVSAYDTATNESPLSAPVTIRTPEPGTDRGILGCWKFDEGFGTTATDLSGNGNSGTIIGATWIPVTTGYALDFDGIDDCVKIVADPCLDNLEAVTMAAWIYPRVDTHWHVLDKGDGDKRIYAEGVKRILAGRIRYKGTHAYSESVRNTIVLNKWQHVALTWSQTTNTTRLFHNGVEVRYSIQDVGSGGVLDDATYPFTVGARGALGDVTYFDGFIDEVHLYERALSAQEIQAVYNWSVSCRSRRITHR